MQLGLERGFSFPRFAYIAKGLTSMASLTSTEDTPSPVVAVPGSAAYISEQQRFERESWRELKREMEEKRCKYQATLKARGRQDYDRAEAISNKMEEGMNRETQVRLPAWPGYVCV